jgi:hypothetical protein
MNSRTTSDGAMSPCQSGQQHLNASAQRGVDGDPLADIKLLENPAKSLVVIMKDGKLFKNMLLK